jgi:hypothetical protein
MYILCGTRGNVGVDLVIMVDTRWQDVVAVLARPGRGQGAWWWCGMARATSLGASTLPPNCWSFCLATKLLATTPFASEAATV